MDTEKLKYLLDHVDYYIGMLIDNVLSDSQTDPHYSAVTAVNMIKCYIQIMNELGEHLPYKTVEEYFDFNAYTKEEYRLFEEKRIIESEYYVGKQY